jgi:hypothetical protein
MPRETDLYATVYPKSAEISRVGPIDILTTGAAGAAITSPV